MARASAAIAASGADADDGAKGAPIALAGPLLAVLAAAIPRDAEGLHGFFLMCALLLLSSVLLAAEYVQVRLPFLSRAAWLVLDRLQGARRNWEVSTLRSFTECVAWISISVRLHAYHGDVLVSAPLGALFGFAVVVAGDLLTETACGSRPQPGAVCRLGDFYARELAVFVVVLAAAVGIRTSTPVLDFGLALLEPIAASVCVVVMSQVLLRCSPGNRAGLVVHDRIVNCVDNWQARPIRSAIELSVWLATTYAVHSRSSGLLPLSAMIGALAGFVVSVVGELCSRIERPHRQTNNDPHLIWREDNGISALVPLHIPEKPCQDGRTLPKFTMAEVAKHNTADDCWIILDNRAYDITRYVSKHPGGVGPVVNMAGKDATDVFANYHAARVYKNMLPQFLVGEVTDVVVYPHVADFRAVRQEMLRLGLFETDYHYYAMHAAWLLTLFLCSLALSLGYIGSGGAVARMLGAAAMGIFWQQLAGLGHDLGHSGVSHDFHFDHKVGSFLSVVMGLSVCWWKSDHNTHHVVCNAIEHDPNIQHMPMLAITPKIFTNPFWDTYHKKIVGMDWIARFLVSNQHLYFYPLMALGRWNLYVQGLIYLITLHDRANYRKTELCGLCMFFVWMFSLVFSMPTWALSIGWIMVSHAVAGILHVQIVLSHWTMETYKGSPYSSKETEWYLMQLRTTMNVATPEWLDWVHIGLQFQIEHHLYPRLPRHNLRKARDMVKAVCKKHGIHYHEPGFFAGNLEMWRALRDTAMEARKTTKGDAGFYESKLWEGLNCRG